MNFLKWLYPGMRFKRWLLLFAAGVMLASLGIAIMFNYKYIDSIEESIFWAVYTFSGEYTYTATAVMGSVMVVIGFLIMAMAARFIIQSVIDVVYPSSSEKLVDLIYEKRMLGKGPAVTVVGGGHGLSVLLRGIKEVTTNVTAVVTVADDGGSSGRLREELGIIPPGDLRNCLVALADTEPLMEKLFQHRFGGSSSLSGHSFGNLFMRSLFCPFFRCHQFFKQLFPRSQTGHFDFNILPQHQAGQANHFLRQVHNLHRLAHIQHKDFAALSHTPSFDYQLAGFRYGHEVPLHLFVGHRQRTALGQLFFKQWHHTAPAAQHVAEPHRHVFSIGITLVQRLPNFFCHPLGSSHDTSGVHGFIRTDEHKPFHPILACQFRGMQRACHIVEYCFFWFRFH